MRLSRKRKLVKFYRWQDENRIGPYRGTLALHITSAVPHDVKTGRPNPIDDNIPHWARCGVYGFLSLEQEQKWFREAERSIMKDAGYKLVCYEVDEDDISSITQYQAVVREGLMDKPFVVIEPVNA